MEKRGRAASARSGRRLRPLAEAAAAVAVMALVSGCSFGAAAPSGSGQPAATPSAAQAPTTARTAATSPASATRTAALTGAAVAAALQSQFVRAVRIIGPSVVLVETPAGLGSGVVFDSRGDIVTNAHVVGEYTSFRVTDSAGKTYTGTLAGVFAPDDLAVIRVAHAGLPPASFGDSSRLAVGDIVMAVGNPLGFQSSVTEGIVSALGRTVSEPTGNALPDVIQTSAPINPGNSGGALIDLEGRVVGIPTLAATDPELGGSAAPGIGFAIPSNEVKNIAAQLVKYGHVVNSDRAYLGIEAASVIVGGAPAVLIYSVLSGGPAARAGLKKGELILSIDGQATPTTSALATVLATLRPGEAAAVRVVRSDGTQATVKVILGQYPG